MTRPRLHGVLTAALAGVLSGTLTGAAHAQVLSNITADGYAAHAHYGDAGVGSPLAARPCGDPATGMSR
jgi:hypothetical protein